MKDFLWTDEYREVFEELKSYLSSPPLLTKPNIGKFLYISLDVSQETVSSVLIREDKKGIQRPIYYASKVLHDVETRYSQVEKVVYVFVILV